MTTTEWRAELGAKTTENLGRFGVAGRVEVENHLVWLIGHGPTVEVRLTESDAARAAQGPAELEQIAERLARELARARRKAAGHADTATNWMGWLRSTLALILLVAGGWLAFRYLLPHPPAANDSPRRDARLSQGLQKPATKLADKQTLDDQNCLRTVSRIQQGGLVSSLDVDGWVVELSLIATRDDLAPAAAPLNRHFQMRPGGFERTQQSALTPILNQGDARQSGVLISKEPLASVTPQKGSGIVITWRGQYVTPYFEPSERSEYVRLANALFDDLEASYGALYARCVQGPARYLGSWFRGPDVGGALWIMIAEMEVASGPTRLKVTDGTDVTEQLRAALVHLSDTLRPITRKRAAYLLASSGGTISERLQQSATVEFPFSPANRANIASSTLAAKVWP